MKKEINVCGRNYTLKTTASVLTKEEAETVAIANFILDDKMTMRAISDVMGISKATVGRRVHQILPEMSKTLYRKVEKQLYLNTPQSLRKRSNKKVKIGGA